MEPNLNSNKPKQSIFQIASFFEENEQDTKRKNNDDCHYCQVKIPASEIDQKVAMRFDCGILAHYSCLKCDLCNRKTVADGKGLFHFSNELLCINCLNSIQCVNCAKQVKKEARKMIKLRNGFQTWHTTCFNCNECRKKINDDDFKLHNYCIYCLECSHEVEKIEKEFEANFSKVVAKSSTLEELDKEPSKFQEFMKTVNSDYIIFAQLAEEFHANPPLGQNTIRTYLSQTKVSRDILNEDECQHLIFLDALCFIPMFREIIFEAQNRLKKTLRELYYSQTKQEKSFENSLKDFTIDPLSLEFVPSLQSLELDDSKSPRIDKSPRSAQKSPRVNKSPRGERPDTNKSPRIRPQLRGKNGTDLKLLLQEHFSNDSALPLEVQTSPRPLSNRPASRSKSKPSIDSAIASNPNPNRPKGDLISVSSARKYKTPTMESIKAELEKEFSEEAQSSSPPNSYSNIRPIKSDLISVTNSRKYSTPSVNIIREELDKEEKLMKEQKEKEEQEKKESEKLKEKEKDALQREKSDRKQKKREKEKIEKEKLQLLEKLEKSFLPSAPTAPLTPSSSSPNIKKSTSSSSTNVQKSPSTPSVPSLPSTPLSTSSEVQIEENQTQSEQSNTEDGDTGPRKATFKKTVKKDTVIESRYINNTEILTTETEKTLITTSINNADPVQEFFSKTESHVSDGSSPNPTPRTLANVSRSTLARALTSEREHTLTRSLSSDKVSRIIKRSLTSEKIPEPKEDIEENHICEFCDVIINPGSLYEVAKGNGRIHESCFNCVVCKCNLQNVRPYVWVKEEKALMCGPCAKNVIKNRCSACQKLIILKFISLENNMFHHKCVKCTECDECNIDNLYLKENGQLICLGCSQKDTKYVYV